MEDNKGRKFAFINFEAADSARKAVEEMNKKDVRSEAQKEKDKEEGKEEEDADHPSYLLYVSRAQSKTERKIELREKFGVPERGPVAPRAQGVNLYVKNLDENIDDESLKELFAPF